MRKKILLLMSLLLFGAAMLLAKEKYALIIGINDYRSPQIRDLNYSEADALYLKDMLIKYARYNPLQVKMLLGSDATYARIKEEIYWLGEVAGKADDVFFYFSGHGTRVPDTDNNEEDGMDEAFCPYETEINKVSTVILDDDIGHWFNRINAGKIIVVLDCCHSGGAAGRSLTNDGSKGLEFSTAATGRGLLNPDADPYARDLTAENKFIVAASDAEEQSYENPTLGHGVFTYYIGEAIRGNADSNGDRTITANEMYEYTRTKTLEFAKTIDRKQTPVKFGTIENAIIAEVGSQMVDLKLYDRDLRLVGLAIGSNQVRRGDLFVIKKRILARDLEVADRDVFKIEVAEVKDKYSEGRVIEEYYANLNIDPNRYSEYYAVKLTFGSLFISTTPWSTVWLDGKEVGPTPLVIPEVPEGEHEIEFKIDIMGYPRSIQKKVTVVGNQKLRVVEKFTQQ